MNRVEKKWSKLLGSDFVEAWKKDDKDAMTEILRLRLAALPAGPQAQQPRASAEDALKKIGKGKWPKYGFEEGETVPA